MRFIIVEAVAVVAVEAEVIVGVKVVTVAEVAIEGTGMSEETAAAKVAIVPVGATEEVIAGEMEDIEAAAEVDLEVDVEVTSHHRLPKNETLLSEHQCRKPW